MIHLKKTLRAAVLGSAAVLVLAASALGQRGSQQREIPPPRTNPQFLAAFRAATAEASQSTVRVLCDDKDAALGTIVGPDGWILTKHSQLSGRVSCMLKDGRTLEAKLFGVHEAFDLAMLKVEATDLPAVKFTESKAAAVGSWLVSVGLGENPVAVGVMSVATRTPPPTPNRGGRGGPPRFGPIGPNRTLVLGATTVGLLASLSAQSPLLAASAVGPSRLPPSFGRRGRLDQNRMGSELSVRNTGFPTYFQSDTVIKPQDCGGPICDLEGHVLGINIARAGRVESYSIPSEALTPLLTDLMSGKLAPKSPETVALEKKITELKAALKKAENDKAAAEKKLQEGQEGLKKYEAEKAEAERKWQEAKDALEKAEKELQAKK